MGMEWGTALPTNIPRSPGFLARTGNLVRQALPRGGGGLCWALLDPEQQIPSAGWVGERGPGGNLPFALLSLSPSLLIFLLPRPLLIFSFSSCSLSYSPPSLPHTMLLVPLPLPLSALVRLLFSQSLPSPPTCLLSI